MKNNSKGFTIIEVVLVLAIAGLIFLAVFIALPALQRGQRDNQRRTDASRFASQLQNYATNNAGNMPDNTQAAVDSFKSGYLTNGTEGFNNPKTGDPYTVSYANSLNQSPNDSTFIYYRGGVCSGETITRPATANKRTAAISIKLEGSGVYCMDAQK